MSDQGVASEEVGRWWKKCQSNHSYHLHHGDNKSVGVSSVLVPATGREAGTGHRLEL